MIDTVDIKIEGLWQGFLIYGKEYGKNSGKKLYFDMTLNLEDNNKISGDIKDTKGYGIHPEKASFQGEYKNGTIHFVKNYPSLHYADRKGNQHIKEKRKGFDIEYFGEYDSHDHAFKGDWIIHGKFNFLGFLPITFKNSGTWTMKKMN